MSNPALTIDTLHLRDEPAVEPGPRIYRHPLPTRLFHWVNALCLIMLLMSGFQIFNVHTRLYWGHVGNYDMPAAIELKGEMKDGQARSWIAVDGKPFLTTTGFFGNFYPRTSQSGNVTYAQAAYPQWLVMGRDLAGARGLHFFFMYFYAINLIVYLIYGVASKRFAHTLVPDRDQVRSRAILRDLWAHVRLKRAEGVDAARYNLLQKLSYGVVLFVLLPVLILSGMTQSPSFLARFPWLIDLFQGRQTARTIHFFCANLMLLFVVVHLFQVLVTGFVKHMRAMITGWLEVPGSKT